MQNTYTAAALAQKAFAKIVKNKKLNTLRILVSFDNNVTQRTANYASGDLCNLQDSSDYISFTINKALENAQQTLRTNNIVVVN